jgi:hypothetical protein
MKILEFKRSEIRLIMEFRGIPNGIPRNSNRISQPRIKAPTKYIVKIPLAYIIVPLFDRNDDSVMLELETGGKNSKQVES